MPMLSRILYGKSNLHLRIGAVIFSAELQGGVIK